ncbi:hypothetical protein [Streptomyces sp. NPDC016845]|uniref:hypothetical protein n=1 Tax=Streptomyces sp. NPDC016845 TaxID=3364972 RepID=UPI0037B0FFC4
MSESWGTVAAAVAAGLLGIGGVLLGLIVGRRQVSDQAQVEHGQWLRGQRVEAYLELLRAWDTALSAIGDLQEDWDQERDATIENVGAGGLAERMRELVVERVNAPLTDAQGAAERVLLVAPPPVAEQSPKAMGVARLRGSRPWCWAADNAWTLIRGERRISSWIL